MDTLKTTTMAALIALALAGCGRNEAPSTPAGGATGGTSGTAPVVPAPAASAASR